MSQQNTKQAKQPDSQNPLAESSSTSAFRHNELLDNEKDLPLLAETQLLSQHLLAVIESQTSPIVKDTIHQLLSGNEAKQTIENVLPKLDSKQAENLIRACSLFAQAFNIAEDRHHERRRLAHEQNQTPSQSSFSGVIQQIQAQGITNDTLQSNLNHMNISAVLTAHPTEVQRQSA